MLGEGGWVREKGGCWLGVRGLKKDSKGEGDTEERCSLRTWVQIPLPLAANLGISSFSTPGPQLKLT